LGEEGGINLYAFVWNNPVNWIDPYGLVTWKGVGGIILIMVGIAVTSRGAITGGLMIVAAGVALTAWDIAGGAKEGQEIGKESMKNYWKQKIKTAGPDAKNQQEEGLIPPCNRLREIGFTDQDFDEVGMCWCK
jgi:uncharacterized protein RhaS with RHS repeats